MVKKEVEGGANKRFFILDTEMIDILDMKHLPPLEHTLPVKPVG